MTGYIGYIEGFAFCTIRPAIALSLVPFGGNESLGVALRVPLMLLFATLPQLTGWPDNLIVAMAVEVLIGLTLGLLLSVVFHAASAAGAIVDQQGGYSIGASYDPNFRDEAALFEHLFGWFATLTFFTGKGLEAVYGFFADAWLLWPPGAPRPDFMRVMRDLSEQRLALSIAEGVKIAMPLVGLMLLVDIALGLMSRYAKRLNPFTTARNVKAIVLCLTIVSCVPVLFERFNAIFLQSAVLR
ncbi:flagellar biosynthetic protein FliR [Paraburkholderia sp. Tr-20389]|uniref:EscT/YscT/HrcT family type III secretion system export apparatus protein n=1 Tax=Paraburkholderia sp. Tr-20389 TaxID=2703903 RepID=UPI0019810DDB|nr:flagellar biosynthetic protein FliR [Paraburkholderia sp. Tr-20389]MBN3754983.1 flagellar biosynthetic protein FliR [Paraburkholderia sp. Tr-20389]